MVRYICVILLFAGVFACAGCEEYEYDIEMTPDGGEIERTISFSSNLPEEQKQAVAKTYPEQIDVNTFSGTFKVELPNDVGGVGYYTAFVTTMGSTATYAERFRGDDDISQHIGNFEAIVDRYADFAVKWLEFELGTEPNFCRLREFIDKKMRADAKNIGLYFWLGGIVGGYDPNADDEMTARATHYLEERGYVAPGQAGVLMQRANRNGEEDIWLVLRDCVAREMGYSANGPSADKMVFLTNGDSVKNSVIRYIQSTERYRQMWEDDKTSYVDPNLSPPEVDIQKFIGEGTPFDFELGSTAYKVKVRLRCSQRPYETNGQWQDADNQVCWSANLSGKDVLPTFFYASWSTPDRDFQARHFGRVILDGKELAEYCYWEKSIEADKAMGWDDFISTLDPNTEIIPAIKAFRLSGESAEPNAPDLADVPRTLILKALSPPAEN